MNERTAVKHFREVSLLYAEIVQQVGCTKSAAFKLNKTYLNTGSFEKRPRNGRPKKTSERGERSIC